MMIDIDKETSSTILFDEFVEMATPKMQSRDTRDEIMKVFKLFDDDNTGTISFKNLQRVARELGESRQRTTQFVMRDVASTLTHSLLSPHSPISPLTQART